MKKYLMMGATAMVLGASFVSCSKETDLYDPNADIKDFIAKYEEAFVKAYGQPASNQTWGFGSEAAASRMVTRSQADPVAADITAPYDEAWVATYNETAKEPNSANVADNYDNSSYATNYGEGGPNSIDWNDPAQVADKDYFFSLSWDEAVAWALANHPTWVTYTADETFVRNFKITGTYSGGIGVAATEGLTDGVENGNQRTIVVTGTWNITEDQRIGSLGKIIIANGGTVNVASGVTLSMVNQARLVVLRGGTLTGEGSVTVNNGNAADEENYNAGTIDVATFNNNFGKFYNYGNFLVNEYQGGAQESNFYNHALVAIDHTSSTANARIFNGCQFYVKNDARLRNYEGVGGSALIVGGQLLFSGSEDGTSDPTYVGLAAGALVKCGSLYNNGTSWSGPTSGYAALEIVNQIDYLNWEQDAPQNGGYFENNIYVKASTWDNIPTGNGYQAGETATADYKFFSIVANCRGNNGVTKVKDGSDEVIPADNDFVLGVAGCTPGFTGDIPNSNILNIRVMAEDLSASEASDFDFNDVVFDVEADFTNSTSVKEVKITLWAAGGTLPLKINSVDGKGGFEVHDALNSDATDMINTHAQAAAVDPYGWADNIAKYETTITLANGASIRKTNFGEDVRDYVRVEVQKQLTNGNYSWFELTANEGKAACKFGVPVGTPWVVERHDLGESFPEFTNWVETVAPTRWYDTRNATYLYNSGMSTDCKNGCTGH